MKRSLAALLAAVGLVAGCGGAASSPSSEASASAPAGPTASTASTASSPSPSSSGIDCAGGKQATITFWHTYNTDGPETKQLNDVVIPAFERYCPNITVKAVVQPYPGLHDQLVTAVAGGGVPDVMRMDIVWTPEFAKLGALSEVDGLSGFDQIKSSVFPGPLATNAYQGKYYGVPLDTNTQVLIYNPKIIAQPPTTLDDLKAAAIAAKGKDVWGLGLGGDGSWNLLPWIWTLGGQVTNPDYTKATGYLDSPQTVAALQWLIDLKSAGGAGPSITGGKPDSWGGFSGGNYGMVVDGPWFFPAVGAAMGAKAATLPTGPGGSISVVGGENLVIFKSSPNQEADWAFSRFLLSDEAQEDMAAVGQMPVTSSASSSAAMTSVDYYAPYHRAAQDGPAASGRAGLDPGGCNPVRRVRRRAARQGDCQPGTPGRGGEDRPAPRPVADHDVRHSPGRAELLPARPGQYFPVLMQTVSAEPGAQDDAALSRRARARRMRELRTALPFMLPGLALVAVFVVYPLLRGLQMSLFHWNLMAPGQSQWVGLDNFVRALTKDPTFWTAVRNTVIYALLTIPAQMAFGLGAAVLLNAAICGRALFRALYYLPVVTSWLVVSYVFAYLFSDGPGPINSLLVDTLHVLPAPIDWIHDSFVTAQVPINLLGIWKGIGWNMVIFLAALQSIPAEILEAASVDGAGVWQRFRRITLPLLRPAILFVSVMLLIGAFNVFISVYLLTGGGPQGSTEVWLSYMWNQAFSHLDFGYGTAIGLLMGIAVIAIGFMQRRYLRGSVEY